MRQNFLQTLLCCTAIACVPAFADDTDARGGSYTQTNLVADQPGVAANTDPNLINAWGVALLPGSPWWVNANGTGTAQRGRTHF